MSGTGAGAEVFVRAAGAVTPARTRDEPLLGHSVRTWAERTRAQLGMADGTIVGAGHQPEWWHPGIVAKFTWADERARRLGASLAWLVVDTDTRDPAAVRFPEVRAGRLSAAEVRFAPPLDSGASPAGLPAFRPRGLPEERADRAPALPCVGDGLARIRASLASHAGARDAVSQVMAAVRDCTPEVGTPACIVRTSEIMATDLGRALAARANQDPAACVRAFNRAVAHAPRTARPLAESGPRGPELPFWTPSPMGHRMRVHAPELPRLISEGAPLWPRAFVTGLFARLALFDRFVHGTGGDAYERATDALADEWLGVRLPPFDVATATLRLPLGAIDSDAGPTPAELRAEWFDPERGRGGPGPRKRALLEAIARAPRASAERRAAWIRMHREMESMRSADRARMDRLAAETAAARERRREHEVRMDRTWAAALHPPGAIRRLAESIRSLPT